MECVAVDNSITKFPALCANFANKDGEMSEYERWERRYDAPRYIFGEEPNAFLASCESMLPDHGTALAVADGEGRNGVWLSRKGLTVTSVDFSPTGQQKARALARNHGVNVTLIQADLHNWTASPETFDVAVDIFTQFSDPDQRQARWDNLKHALKHGGLLILAGYTPKQLDYGTGGPKVFERFYTRGLLTDVFGDFHQLVITESEVEMSEGSDHTGMSAIITLTGFKP